MGVGRDSILIGRRAEGEGLRDKETMTKQPAVRFKIRSVSDGGARGWGPARIKE
jgi:hypothetical protein